MGKARTKMDSLLVSRLVKNLKLDIEVLRVSILEDNGGYEDISIIYKMGEKIIHLSYRNRVLDYVEGFVWMSELEVLKQVFKDYPYHSKEE